MNASRLEVEKHNNLAEYVEAKHYKDEFKIEIYNNYGGNETPALFVEYTPKTTFRKFFMPTYLSGVLKKYKAEKLMDS
jgi:hypothetical protein